MHTAKNGDTIDIVGLALGPFIDGPIQCVKKDNMVDIREINIQYIKNGEKIEFSSDNGYEIFMKIIKYILIDTISVEFEPVFRIYNDFSQVSNMNQDIFNKIIYWTYDVSLDVYDMDTYENTKSNSFQETIKIMNAKIYDRIILLLNRKLQDIVEANTFLPFSKIEMMVEMYSTVNRLFLKQNDKRELLIKKYLQNKQIDASKIYQPQESKIEMPIYEPIIDNKSLIIKIDTVNPLHPQEYIQLQAYSRTTKDKNVIARSEGKCKHESEWNEINKIKTQNLNKYNSQMTLFIEKFSLETTQLDYVCKICGQILPLKQYVQDGSFDNNTQKFVTAYVPSDIPLEEIREYTKYKLSIRYLDALINRVSLITSTNMLVGPSTQTRQKEKHS
nr:hypothetical protein [Mimivirus sp.]